MKNLFKKISIVAAGLILLCTSVNLHAQVKAAFTANTKGGCTPLVVNLTDSSTGNPTWWKWDLGNGSTSTEQNPGLIYIAPGSYSITLIAGNSTSGDTLVKKSFIQVYALPDVSFTATPTTGCLPLDVTFSNKSIANSGSISETIWDFGDGNISKTFSPKHTYTSQGSFNVTLSVFNNYGCKQSVTMPDLVKTPVFIESDFNYTYTSVCQPPSTITFENNSNSNVPLTHTWNFGDGTTSTEQSPAHIYVKSGTFKVMLISQSASGCTDTATKSIAIGSVAADFKAPDSICTNEVIVFTGIVNPQPESISWVFSDGATEEDSAITHAFTSSGIYKVEMTADFGSCVSTVTKTIVVADKPKPLFEVDVPPSGCSLPLQATFINNTSGASSYKWIFGDGTTSTEVNPVHNYTKAGSYTVSLISFNGSGCSDTLVMVGAVKAGPPQITGFVNLPTTGCAPKLVDFAATIISADPVSSYRWSFGDGTSSTQATPSHTYTEIGSYKVSLTINPGTACAATYTMPNAVELGAKPKAAFSATPRAVCATNAVSFKDESSKDVTSWSWFFGDGGSSGDQNPNYRYIDTGYFSVTLIANNKNCADTLTIDDYIQIYPPIAKFSPEMLCALPYDRTFKDKSVGAQTWAWDFGDGITASLQSPAHKYTAKGAFVVTLKVTNGDCESIAQQTIHVIDDNPTFTVNPDKPVCKNDVVTFAAAGYLPSDYTSITWRFGDGVSLIGRVDSMNAVYRYKAASNYRPSLLLVDLNNCADSVSGKKDIVVYGPTANFGNAAGTCANSAILFNDSTKTDGLHNITNWQWNYGDGVKESKSTAPFQHVYLEKNIYNVSLKVTDSYGCSDSIMKKKVVRITKPVANFVASDTIACASTLITFTSKSSVYKASAFEWSLGDGTVSRATKTSKRYTAQGTYDISLKVQDKFGCRDSITKPKYITIVNPVASFSLFDSVGQCPPLLSEPRNVSTGYKSLTWKFGDGSSSTVSSPQHYYSIPGTYELQLVVKGYGNCYDSTSKKILLKGPWGTLNYTPTTACVPLKVGFSSQAKNVAEYIWDFNNGVIKQTTQPSSDYTYTSYGSYLPKLVLVDSAGCRVSIENKERIIVSDIDARIKDAISVLNSCDSAVRVFADSSIAYYDSITSYHWDFGDNKTYNGKSSSHYFTKSGLYNVTLAIASKAGCKDQVTLPLTVNINKAPVFSISFKDSVCEKSPLQFNVTPGATDTSLTWAWGFGDGAVSALQNPAHAYNVGGKYTANLKATSPAGCVTTKAAPVFIVKTPLIDAGLDTVICYGGSVVLKATGGVNYTWNANQTLSCINCATPVAKPTVSTTYFATGTNLQGCKASDSVFVKVSTPITLLAAKGSSLCLGQTTKLSVSGAEVIEWTPKLYIDNPNSATPNFTASTAGDITYTITGRDKHNCYADTASVTVKVYPIPSIKITTPQLVANAGFPVPILTTSSADITKWKWSPATGLDNPNKAQPVLNPTVDATYTVTATNDGNCTATDRVTVSVLCDGKNLFIPNTFSPNNDGMNDVFFVHGKGINNIRSLRIFNRWGQVVFEKMNFSANSPSDGWDGTFRSKEQGVDVYVFMMEVLCDNGTVNKINGNITLIR